MRNKSSDFTEKSAFGPRPSALGQRSTPRLVATSAGRRPKADSRGLLFFFLLFAVSLVFAAPQDLAPRADTTAGAGRQIFDLLNRERVRAGLAPLVWDHRLAAAAQEHAQLMGERNQLSHQLPHEPPLSQRLTAVPLNHSGENVAVAPTAAEVHEALMNSPPHRANILDTHYNAVGMGIVRTGTGLWVVQDFAERIPEVTGTFAADQIAMVFNDARMEAGYKPLVRDEVANLPRLACDMAQRGRADASSVLRLPGARNGIAYTTLDPQRLPADLLRLRNARDVKHFAVGACFAKTAAYPSGTYWVLVGLFAQ